VTVTARDSKGQPYKNLSLRSEILVGGVLTDFGSLSAHNLVTDAAGHATVVYTAPAAPAGPNVDNYSAVNIMVTPIGTDFGNSSPRLATIRLVPPGIVIPPDGLQPQFTFTPTSPTDHQTVLFDASSSRSPGNNPIVSFSWNFGDGATSSGVTATHSYSVPGTYVVTLTIADSYNRSASTTQTLDVAGGTEPSASFVTSPSTPHVGETVNFNASATKPAPGRTIRSYQWDFGDGEMKTTSGPTTTHDYQKVGVFNVTLVVTDDVGRVSVGSGSVTIVTDAPTAEFTFSQLPSPPASAHTVQLNSAASSAIAGRTIVAYAWDFGDGTGSTLANPVHTYAGAASFNITLTVTDNVGKVGRVTKTVQVQ
jgi:PKD repeat protein